MSNETEYATIELKVPNDVARMIKQLAQDACVTPDQAASVLVAMALRKYVPMPVIDPKGAQA